MDDKIKKFLEDTITHKQLVLESGRILSNYLLNKGEFELAIELLKRCAKHDDSKFDYEEIMSFVCIPENNDGMKNPNTEMDDFIKKAIALHWKKNSHHPEYHDDVLQMSELDVLEMACDCYSRSLQFHTDLIQFIEIRQKERFNLPQELFNKYKKYCEILVEEGNKALEQPKIKSLKKD